MFARGRSKTAPTNVKSRLACFYKLWIRRNAPPRIPLRVKIRGARPRETVGANCVRPRAVKDRPYECEKQVPLFLINVDQAKRSTSGTSPCKRKRHKRICGCGGIGRLGGFRCCHLREGFLFRHPHKNLISGHAGIGRLDGFRFRCREACGFESHCPHHRSCCLRAAASFVSPVSFLSGWKLISAPVSRAQ